MSGQADPQSLWIMPLGQAGARVVLTGGGGGVDNVKDKCYYEIEYPSYS